MEQAIMNLYRLGLYVTAQHLAIEAGLTEMANHCYQIATLGCTWVETDDRGRIINKW